MYKAVNDSFGDPTWLARTDESGKTKLIAQCISREYTAKLVETLNIVEPGTDSRCLDKLIATIENAHKTA